MPQKKKVGFLYVNTSLPQQYITNLKMSSMGVYNFDELEDDIRLVENLIQEAKNTLAKYWDDYADIQRWMGDAEQLRMSTDILLSKHLSKGLE